MSAAAKAQSLIQPNAVLIAADELNPANRRVARDFALLLGVALGIGLIAATGMMLAVLALV